MAPLKSLKRRKLTSGTRSASGRRLRREKTKAEAQNKSELSAGITGQKRSFHEFGEDGDGDVELNEKELVCLLRKYLSLS
jgi:hypothetical protein